MKNTNLFTILLAVLLLAGCAGTAKKETKAAEPEYPPLYELAGNCGFKMGAALSPNDLQSYVYQEMLETQFNSVTFTNELKLYSLLDWSVRSRKGMPALKWGNVDSMLKYCSEHNIKVRGHVLVWDAYMTEWFFYEDYRTKKLADEETIRQRMKYCIEKVIGHCEEKYPGTIYAWDVVNEAVADGPAEAAPGDKARIRKSRGGVENLYYTTLGHDYVKWAFKYARDFVEENNYDIKLFYNDYNTFQSGKRAAILTLVDEVNSADPVINPEGKRLCDGIGMQGYVGGYGSQNGCMSDGDIYALKESIEMYASRGYEVQITEMAVRNYDNGPYASKLHAEYYGKMADMLAHINETADGKFTGWSIWGIIDNPSLDEKSYNYKMNGPYCGMFDWRCKKKPEYFNVAAALSKKK